MIRRILARPESPLILTFASLITVGTLVLALPVAHGPRGVGFVDALFTATSATCVTGLITVDTATAYSRFGQVIILALIQLGGLGLLIFGVLAAELLHVRVSFNSQAALQDMFFQAESVGKLTRAIRYVLVSTVLIEGAGAVLLYIGLCSDDRPIGGAFEAVFHAVSAFCNAGFSLFTENAVALRHSTLMMWTMMGLITLGGLGYPVLLETATRAWRRLRRSRAGPVNWTLHARVVLRVSVVLSLGGAAALFIFGVGDPAQSPAGRLLDALFQSVTARTAGFNTVNIEALPLPSLLVLVLLMFIGGSPGSCAGGIKTTTATIWAGRVTAHLRGREAITFFSRRVPPDFVRRATLIVAVAALWNAAGILLLSITEGGRDDVRFEQIIFEQFSAFGTVGLSANFTHTLSTAGKLWIIATMFVGRVGPLTVAFIVMARPRKIFDYPTERVMIG